MAFALILHDILLSSELFREVSYTPQGGSPKNIQMLMKEDTEQVFGNADIHDYDEIEILISSVDNVQGHVAPKITGRDGDGDSFVTPDTGKVFFVKKILEDGRDSETKMHRLFVASIKGLLIDE